MDPRWRPLVLGAGWLGTLGACASPGTTGEGRDARPATPAVAADAPVAAWEPWPPPGRRDEERRPPSGEQVALSAPEDGVPVLELLSLVTARTGAVFVHDASPQSGVQAKRIRWTGTLRVPQSRLLDLGRSLLWHHGLVLVPSGPLDGAETWVVTDAANPNATSRPVQLHEEEVLAHADCDGLVVCTTFRIRDTLDTQRVRGLLLPLSTQTAGIGRVQDADASRTVAVRDLAPVVATMKRIVDDMNRNAAPPQPSAPPQRAAGAGTKPGGGASK